MNYLKRVYDEMLRWKQAAPVPKWAADVLRFYQHYKETGALPDNRGLDFNNPWLIEAFEALMEVEGKFLNAMMEQVSVESGQGVKLRKWKRDEMLVAREQARKAAEDLARIVEQLRDEGW